MTITVRYFAGAQAAAGIDQEDVALPDGAGLNSLVAELTQRHGAALGRVLGSASFLINEVTGPAGRLVPDGATVDVLPPFAGG